MPKLGVMIGFWGLVTAVVLALLGLILPPFLNIAGEISKKNVQIEQLSKRVTDLEFAQKVQASAQAPAPRAAPPTTTQPSPAQQNR